MIVKDMHHGDDLVEHRTHEASFVAQCTNHSAVILVSRSFGVLNNERHLTLGDFEIRILGMVPTSKHEDFIWVAQDMVLIITPNFSLLIFLLRFHWY